MPTTPVVLIVGPTAVGKTSLALSIAQQFNGEIINSDSRQVYRGMDIGTAKITSKDRQQIPHHLIDILDPDEDFGLARFLLLSSDALIDVHRRKKLAIVVGGTGQYIWALVDGWQVPAVPPNPEFRAAKVAEAEEHGPEFIYRQLQKANPERAKHVDPRNVRRVIRALEIYRGEKYYLQSSDTGDQGLENRLIIGLTMDRKQLYQRIDDRVDRMILLGLEEEVRALVVSGYTPGQGALAGPGYREFGEYLEGRLTLDEAIQRTKFQTHRLARRQYNWFKQDDARITWLDGNSPNVDSQAAKYVEAFLSEPACHGTISELSL